jgi:hypothetical protein
MPAVRFRDTAVRNDVRIRSSFAATAARCKLSYPLVCIHDDPITEQTVRLLSIQHALGSKLRLRTG